MGLLRTFKKTPADRKRYTIDYSNWLDVGETIGGATYTMTAISPTTATLPNFSSHTISSDALSVSVFVGGGDDGATYKMLITMTTIGGQIKEDELKFIVHNNP